LITLCSAYREPDPAVLACPGGFTWFYVDLIDEQGQGATVIWSWGLPFLPGYAGAARAGHPELPIDRPSVNIVVYGGGRERFYLLSEFPREECTWSADGRSWRLGDSVFAWVDQPGAAGAGTIRTVQATLDLALPAGGRVTGELRLSGPLRRDCSEERLAPEPDCTHTWTPMIAACRGSLELHTPGGDLRIDGRAYHDRNSATAPLHDLGIQSWWWGRLALPGRDLVFYRLTPSDPALCPRDIVVELAADGSSRALQAHIEPGRMRRSSWGLRWPATATFPDPDGLPVEVEVSSVLDNGPFYQRYLLRGRCGADEGYGVGENVVPDRVDSDLLRPLVRMRVHRAAGPNSMWLPLFSGDSAGRWTRLLGQASKVRA
jgi:carotenoid 1,2-hydratase